MIFRRVVLGLLLASFAVHAQTLSESGWTAAFTESGEVATSITTVERRRAVHADHQRGFDCSVLVFGCPDAGDPGTQPQGCGCSSTPMLVGLAWLVIVRIRRRSRASSFALAARSGV